MQKSVNREFITFLICFITLLGSSKCSFAQTECKPTEEFEVGDTATYKFRLLPILKCETLKKLAIRITENRGWVVFSSLQGIDQGFRYSNKVKLGFLSEDIAIAKNLESLEISELGIDQLPNGIINLSNLEVLDISFNRLDIAKELPKILSLSNLKTLKMYGSKFSETELYEIKNKLPQIKILYSPDHLLEESKALRENKK